MRDFFGYIWGICSTWIENPYENYAVVPDDMVEAIMETKGFCDITVEDGVVIGFVASEILEIPEPEPEPTMSELMDILLGGDG